MRLSKLSLSLAFLYIALVRVGYGTEPDEAQHVFPELKEMAKDGRPDVRLWAATRLGAISAEAKEAKDAIPVLMGLLDDVDPQVQSSASESLGHMGVAAKDAAWKLTGLLQNANWLVRSSAANALAQIGPAAQAIVPHMISLLQDYQWDTRRQAAEVLAGIGPTAGESAIGALEVRLGDPDPLVRVSAAEALTKVHSNPGAAIPALRGLRYDVHPGVRKSLADILGRINPEGPETLYRTPKPETVAASTELQQSVDKYLKDANLREPNQDLVGATKTFAEALKQVADCEERIRQADKETIDADLYLKALDAVPVHVDLLADGDYHVRFSAVEALGYFGEVAKKARERLDNVDKALNHASEPLDQASRQFKAAGDQLEKAGSQQLNDVDKQWLSDAKKAMEKAKQQQTDTEKRLTAKKDERRRKGQEAEKQLAEAKTQMENAKAQLRARMLDDSDWAVRQAACDALALIRIKEAEKTAEAAKSARP